MRRPLARSLVLGRGRAWTPASLGSSLALWLDAADVRSIVLNGSTVVQWNDKSANSWHATQSTAANQPTYITAGLNGLGALSFDGTNDAMSCLSASLPTGNSARSMFVVYKPERTTANNTIAGQSSVSTVSDWFNLQFRISPAGDPYFAGFANDLTDGAAITLGLKSGGATHDGVTTMLFRNGSQIAQGLKTLSTTSSILRIGTSVSGEFAQMILGEIVFTSRALSTSEVQLLSRYFARKWGL